MELQALYDHIVTTCKALYQAPKDVQLFIAIPITVYITTIYYYSRPCRRRTLTEFATQQAQATERLILFFYLLWLVFLYPGTGRALINCSPSGWQGNVKDLIRVWKWGGWIWCLFVICLFCNDHETAAYRPGTKRYVRDYRLHMLCMGKADGDGWEIRRSYALEAYQERWQHIYPDVEESPPVAYHYRTERPESPSSSRSSSPATPPVFTPVRGHPRVMRCWVPENDSFWLSGSMPTE